MSANSTAATCPDGLLLPIFGDYEDTWNPGWRAFLYVIGMVYCFLGIAIVADIFMGAIEVITSKTRKIYLATAKEGETEVVEVRVWNDTVANLTLMAMGSSAPEILLSCIEIVGRGFESGELGPGTIVGSAAFNLLGITAICVVGIPNGESRTIKMFRVFLVTTVFSIWAYLWLLIILKAITPNVVDLWEALLTFLMFPLLVLIAFMVDRGLFDRLCALRGNSRTPNRVTNATTDQVVDKNGTQQQIELGVFQPEQKQKFFKKGKLDRDALLEFYKEVRKYPGMTDEDAAILAATKLVENQPHTRLWYRIGAVRNMSGGRKLQPLLKDKLKVVYDVINAAPDAPDLGTVTPEPDTGKFAIVEFRTARCAVMENIGKFNISLVRRGRLDIPAKVRVESLDGTAVSGEDYVSIDQVVEFAAGEIHKEISVEIVNDNQWEPDEEFFLRITLVDDAEDEVDLIELGRRILFKEKRVKLGRLPIMEVTILNDDEPGTLTFTKRGILVKESIGSVQIPVERRNGADGVVSVKWKTIDKTANSGKDFTGGEGILEFQHTETERVIEIPIVDDMEPEKDECFEVELFDATGGASIGPITRIAVTITNDDAFDSVMDRMMAMTNASMETLRVSNSTWASQFRDAMNVNGGDIENATNFDYVMHFLTFLWKVFFAFIPPPSLLGGWLCFVVSLLVIGLITAIVGDLASIFGCLVNLEDTITAITFVALGTSVPDLFASKTAAVQEKYADNAVGNVTGSNSVNVFFGLGLPWLLAAVYHQSKGGVFRVDSGDVAFSVMIYTVVAVLAVGMLLMRRYLAFFGKAELGGPTGAKLISGLFLISLWLFYVLMSALKAYGHIKY